MRLRTFDDKKKYLKRCTRMFDKFKNLTNRLADLECEYDETGDESLLMLIDDTKFRIGMLYENHQTIRREVYRLIDTLENQKQIDVLEQFFIYDKTLNEIAFDMGYSERHVIRLYKDGVNSLTIET